MPQTEQVLIVDRKVLEEVGMFNGLAFDVDSYLSAIFSPSVPRFVPRPEAEENPNLKQLIPYVIMACDDTYLTYVRGKRAGETRLVGNRSIGIGGHINPIDNELPLFDTDYRQMYTTAVKREVAEEVTIDTDYTDNIVALLNDESNEVGSVHLGVVHFWKLSAPNVTKREQMITQMEFMKLEQLNAVKDSMETWSQICLAGLHQMTDSINT